MLNIQVITEISPGDNFYTVQLFPLIRPRNEIKVTLQSIYMNVLNKNWSVHKSSPVYVTLKST